jgi:hypothetical protein
MDPVRRPLTRLFATNGAGTLRKIYDADVGNRLTMDDGKSMKEALGSVAGARSRLPRKNRIAFEDILCLRIGALIEERDALEEEVRQLRAALQIYTEVLRRLEVAGPEHAA